MALYSCGTVSGCDDPREVEVFTDQVCTVCGHTPCPCCTFWCDVIGDDGSLCCDTECTYVAPPKFFLADGSEWRLT